MAFTPPGARGTAAGGQFGSAGGQFGSAGGNQARGASGAGTNSGSFKAVGHSDQVSVLASAAPVPGYIGPLHPAGSRMGGLPTWMSDTPRESRPALDPDSKGLLDADLQGILSDPSLTENDKESYRSMADALESKGAGYTNAGLGERVTFLPGSYYGGRPVPEGFKRFHAKLDADGRAAAAARDERDRQRRAADASPLHNVPQGVPLAPAGTGYGRIGAADFDRLEAIRKARHDEMYVAPGPVLHDEQEALLVEMSGDADFMQQRHAAPASAIQAAPKRSVLGKLFGR
jgi:hypothetical protein